MSIVSLDEVLEFIGVDRGYFQITAANDVLVLTYDAGAATNIDVADGTYDGTALAAALKSAIDTAFSITSTVSWDSDTRKFTIAVAAGHNITFTLSGSDAALTFGFTANAAAALSITSDMAAGDPTTAVSLMHDGVEAWAKSHMRKDIESTSYALKRYDGTGSRCLFLDDYPVTAFTKLAIGTRTAMQITNTSTASTASVSVTSTGLVLELNGVTDATCTFASYTTITTLVAAVNALGSGWAASAITGYGSFKSSELLETWGQNCIDSNYVDLDIAEESEDDYELDPRCGKITLGRPFPRGTRNVITSYTAGYSSTTMPDDIRLAILILVQACYRKRQDETFGLTSMSAAGIQAVFLELPTEVRMTFDRYRRTRIR